MSLFDRASIRRNFSRAARDYDRAASLQREAGGLLLENLGLLARPPARVLDLGCGTGRLTRELKRRFPRALVVGLDLAEGMLRMAARRQPWWRRFRLVQGDAAAPPFADGAFDLVLANLLLQWCEDPLRLFAEVRRILAPGGLFLFSSFGPETLAELRAAFAAPERHLSPFSPPEALGAALLATGLRHPVLERELRWRRYRDFAELAAELRALGARNALSARPRGLGGRRELAEARRRFEQARDPSGTIPVRWELVLGLAFAPAPREATPGPRGGIALVPADRIPVRGRREGA